MQSHGSCYYSSQQLFVMSKTQRKLTKRNCQQTRRKLRKISKCFEESSKVGKAVIMSKYRTCTCTTLVLHFYNLRGCFRRVRWRWSLLLGRTQLHHVHLQELLPATVPTRKHESAVHGLQLGRGVRLRKLLRHQPRRLRLH